MSGLFGDCPSWIDADMWDAFVEMRKAKGKRAPFTDRAAREIIKELDRLRAQGCNPTECLRQSVMNGWSGVFSVKAHQQAAQSQTHPASVPVEQAMPRGPSSDEVRAAVRRAKERGLLQ